MYRGTAIRYAAQKGAWENLKTKFKSKFMIGDTYEHYMNPSTGIRRDSKYDPPGRPLVFRQPAPGSVEHTADIPRTKPEHVLDNYFFNRGEIPVDTSNEFSEFEAPVQEWYGKARHQPHPAWIYDRKSIKHLRRVYLESGQLHVGVPIQRPIYHSVKEVRDEWEDVPVIRDPRIPRF